MKRAALLAWLLAQALQGCFLESDESCAEDCIARGRDDGHVDTAGLRCVCLIYGEDGGP